MGWGGGCSWVKGCFISMGVLSWTSKCGEAMASVGEVRSHGTLGVGS